MSGSTKLFFAGPAGKLEALWRPGAPGGASTRAAILCHPHPLFGGTMENKVVARSARYISEMGIEGIRFNFRGVGQSEGKFDAGNGERDDLNAVIQAVLEKFPDARLAVGGFSFGAFVGLIAGDSNPAVRALVGIAPPVRMFDFGFLTLSSKPKLIVYAGDDQYTNAETTKAWIDTLKQPVEPVFVPGVDHFFGPQVDFVGRKVAEFVARVL